MSSQNWSRESLAWLAGVLEGEGTFCLHKGHSPRIQLEMTDEDIVRRAHSIAGFGAVYSRPRRHRNDSYVRKDTWRWDSSRHLETYALLVAVLPWMGTRRRARIVEVLSTWHQWQLELRGAA